MSASPLIFQKNVLIEKHQLEGNDPPGRYFSRAVLITRTATGYTAKAQYESVIVETPSLPTIESGWATNLGSVLPFPPAVT